MHQDVNPLLGIVELHTSMHSLTVLRPCLNDAPMQSLIRLFRALIDGNAFSAVDEYHSLTHALLTSCCRRVSGDLFRDYLLYVLFEKENLFSSLASRGIWDEPLAAAFRLDLKRIEPFLSLTSMALKQIIAERCRELRQKPRREKDSLSVLSSAVWGGGSTRPLPNLSEGEAAKQNQQQVIEPLPLSLHEDDWPSWRYAKDEHLEPYVAEAALEELYRRLELKEPATLLDDIWSLHATCGTGRFLKSRLFTFDKSGSLKELPSSMLKDEDFATFYEVESEQLLHNAISFMRAEYYSNVFIHGESGSGKSTLVFRLAVELPELRVIYCPPGSLGSLINVLDALSAAPLRFVVFLDDFIEEDPLWPALLAALSPMGVFMENIMLIAASKSKADDFFTLKLELMPLQLNEFIDFVELLLLKAGKELDFQLIRNACIDYAAQSGKSCSSPLTLRASKLVVSRLLSRAL